MPLDKYSQTSFAKLKIHTDHLKNRCGLLCWETTSIHNQKMTTLHRVIQIYFAPEYFKHYFEELIIIKMSTSICTNSKVNSLMKSVFVMCSERIRHAYILQFTFLQGSILVYVRYIRLYMLTLFVQVYTQICAQLFRRSINLVSCIKRDLDRSINL